MDECRAECVGAYFTSNKQLLELCGFADSTSVTALNLK